MKAGICIFFGWVLIVAAMGPLLGSVQLQGTNSYISMGFAVVLAFAGWTLYRHGCHISDRRQREKNREG